MSTPIEILKDKMKDNGRDEAHGKVCASEKIYPDMIEFVEAEFPNAGKDIQKALAITWSALLV